MQLAEVKRVMAGRTEVRYDGGAYYVEGCCLRIRNGTWYYQLILHDLKADSVCIAEMEKVESGWAEHEEK